MVLSSHNATLWYEQAKALLHQRVDSKLHFIKTVQVSREFVENDYVSDLGLSRTIGIISDAERSFIRYCICMMYSTIN